jgi:hypothetical protein
MIILEHWTVRRASGVGVVTGVISVILWPFSAYYQDLVRALYVVALAVTAFCGASILWITATDILLHPRRGQRMRPVRAFDIALGLLLAVPTLSFLVSFMR